MKNRVSLACDPLFTVMFVLLNGLGWLPKISTVLLLASRGALIKQLKVKEYFN